jgi:hypothetical protein
MVARLGKTFFAIRNTSVIIIRAEGRGWKILNNRAI